MLGVSYALYHLIAILYMLVKILYSRVEDISKTMLPKILNANYTVNLGKRVLIVQPQALQLLDRIQVLLVVVQRFHKIVIIDSKLIDNSLDEGLISKYEVDDGFTIVLRNVLGLAYMGQSELSRTLLIRSIRILLIFLLFFLLDNLSLFPNFMACMFFLILQFLIL